MVPTETFDRATLGAHGEPCSECRTPLARDQRYCLSCGARRAGLSPVLTDAPLVLGATAAPGEVAPPPIGRPPEPPAATQPPPRRPRFSTDANVLAGAACLLLALLVGVLIGRAGRDPAPTRAAAPQVITVGGAGAAAPAATPTATAAPTETATATATAATTPAKGKTKKDAKAIEDIQGATGEDYSKKSAKLPKTLTTPGKPPPKDDKPAGGGSESETFK
jgi:hypothetical protein